MDYVPKLEENAVENQNELAACIKQWKIDSWLQARAPEKETEKISKQRIQFVCWEGIFMRTF